MIKKILIANRGEIAVRIIRTLKEMDISTVAVYSEADKDSLHVKMADEAVCIGPSQSHKSYLNMYNILIAAKITGADAIHPGYGFLSENEHFAKLCEDFGIIFIGPKAEHIRLLGDKAFARNTAYNAGVPIVPGTRDKIYDLELALKEAEKIGYPLILKAVSGGGGKGIRIIKDENELKRIFKMAQREAERAFGDPAMYLEKYIAEAKHIEFQILADKFGNVIYLGERDCSIQRKNQKIIEEAPSIILDKELRKKMGEAAVKIAKAVKYENAGTVEFLLDNEKNFYFIEMNTRIQVEHPVTELVTGIDLIKEQILIASGHPLSYKQEEIDLRGHAIELRINAEDPEKNFEPSPGKIEDLHLPGGFGIRVDTSIYKGYFIPPFYDSMIGKIIVWGKDRNEAIIRANRALDEFKIKGVKSNVKLLKKIINSDKFKKGHVHTKFVENII